MLASPNLAMQESIPLSEEDRNEIDNLLASAEHGDGLQKAQARASLLQLREVSDAHQTYIAEQQAADAMIDANLDALRRRYDRRVSEFPHRQAQPPVSHVRFRFGAVFGTLALAAAAATVWMINPVLSQQEGVSPVGVQTRLALDDGSHVLLNTGTTVRFSNRLHSREATLVHGEALFTVAHSTLRPFHVRAGSEDVQDVGTQFSVRLLDPGIDVAVVKGAVAVTLPGQESIQLLAGQAVRTDGVRVVQHPRVDTLVAWKDNRLNFNRTPLSEVVRELQRYRSTPIVLADERAGAARVSGGFSSTDPDQLLKTLPYVAPVSVIFEANGTARIASR